MESNFQSNSFSLGDLIQEISIKNDNLGQFELLGVNLEKRLIKSVANTVDVDMSGYKLLRKNQFVCKLMSVGRDEALPIAYNNTHETALVSSAYYVFENKRKDIVTDEYLMEFLSKSDLGRRLWFLASGDVRGGVNWEQFCATKINIPSIDIQHRVVKMIMAIDEKINKINKKNVAIEKILEFLSSKVLENSENTFSVKLADIAKISAGGDNPAGSTKKKTNLNTIPIFSNGSTNDGLFGYTDKAKIKKPSITISARGYLGFTFIHYEPYTPIVRLISITPNDSTYLEYLYYYFKGARYADNGTAQQQVTIPYFKGLDITIPDNETIKTFHDKAYPLFQVIIDNKNLINCLKELRRIVASKFIC